MQAHHQTRPQSPRATMAEAINLAKAGQKGEAVALFREILALQPVNQAAWLWLSAMTSDRAEAEAALKQARQINSGHPSLVRAEQWFVHRFSEAAVTKKVAVVQSEPAAEEAAPKASSGSKTQFWNQKKWPRLYPLANSLGFSLTVLAVLFGLCVLGLGLVSEFRATALASELLGYPGQAEAAEEINAVDPPLELSRAWLQEDWARAVAILENLHQLRPTSLAFKAQLAQAHLEMGLALRSRGFVEEALAHFERAVAVMPGQAEAEKERRLASTYLARIEDYQAGRWPEAVAYFELVWQENKAYPHIRDLLYSAHYNQALALQAANQLPEAKTALEAAIGLHPTLSDPRRLMGEIEFAMAPQTAPDPSISMTPLKDRTVVVGIAEQRMLVYEGKRQVFDFVVSTGEPGSDTAIGEFEIQNKIEMAYANTWNLDMPYWLGIYWAGPLQNGIHALPIVKHTGYKLWDGYLGQRVSYGCVILGDEDAAKLFAWAEVGTKVKIVSSLNQWLAETGRATN